ncbi:MAG: nitrate reductase subunit alpha [Gemmatimonadetes bacterium]|nr:nitrate reductase subunit alpha [Gemmatimonadota bacterium]
MSDKLWIQDNVDPHARSWEEFYRNRWQYDKTVRSTHGVNCTGGCTWQIHVKDGIVTWEMQGLDYPEIDPEIPPYEPRGCQRGISYSWYLYSPLRVKYPYIRGALVDLWRTARAAHEDPVEAWRSLVSDDSARARWLRARGKGGFRRASWDEALELICASMIHTIKTHGPDRIAGFSPIPAMSMISYASGARMLQLMGGVALSFYDWYCDLPSASPETWGEQTDVNESADWYNAKLLAVMGSNLNMTRTPDCHFAAEARHNGTKMYVFAPDFSQVSKYADTWLRVNAGQDGAWWMAVNHVILKEFHHDRAIGAFQDYLKQYSDAPHLVELVEEDGKVRPGQLLRANRLEHYSDVENGDWQFLFWDTADDRPKLPSGAVGSRWAEQNKGHWNLKLEDITDGSAIDPVLSFLNGAGDTVMVEFDDFAEARAIERGVPARKLKTAEGKEVVVTTTYDLLMAQYGVPRGLPGAYAASYDDEDAPYTPAWQERFTGLGRKDLIQFAREWASTAEHTGGKCTIIIGAGINHWYHANLMYRAGIHALMLCGCIGKNGGGLAHYVGQEKLAPAESWGAIALGKDWFPTARLQNAPSWHYVHTDQWRYEKSFTDYHTVPPNQKEGSLAQGHTMDVQVRAVKNGWLPFYPQFTENSLEIVEKAKADGAADNDAVVEHALSRIKSGDLKFAVEDPDAPESWPRVWFIWRGNALMSSSKGHEYFLKHYLGTHHNEIADEIAGDSVTEITYRDIAPEGKMDLVVDLNFRMDTSALYSDVVLPAATWYEKADLNSTDMHSFVHPLSEAVPPCWESKSDWGIFRAVAERFSKMAERHFPEKVDDLVAMPLAHDTPAEIAQPQIRDWSKDEIEAIPGKTMPNLKVVSRDYKNLYRQYTSLGPLVRDKGIGAHGTHYKCDEFYDELTTRASTTWEGATYPSIEQDVDVCNAVLRLATVSNGELAYRSYKNMEERTGLPLAHIAEKSRSVRMTYEDLQTRPHRYLSSPMWSGLIEYGRAYSPYTYNHDHLVPWRTLTGRQHFYLDHPGYLQFGEHLPTYKPKPTPHQYSDLRVSDAVGKTMMLNYLTPHGKWHIHSTYGDNQRMTTLSRGCEPFWMNDKDAAQIEIADNDWVEVHNDHGVVVTRACVSARIPRGICIIYHSPERTYGVPKSPLRGNRRGGGHNSLTRTRLKPNLMIGGYGQFTYHFNYWGPIGCNRDTHVYVRRLPELRW